jgi:hypothetical protein
MNVKNATKNSNQNTGPMAHIGARQTKWVINPRKPKLSSKQLKEHLKQLPLINM